MKRRTIRQLREWKGKKDRKPLIIRGARQVGKTWLMRELGRTEFKQMAYVNFESSTILKNIFIQDFNIQRILNAIQIETGVQIKANDTLIILDEIQEADRGVTALKCFYENAPELHVVAAGSLLGISLHKNTSFPVGKVEFLDLYPLSFSEFLLALGEDDLLNLLESKDWPLIKSFKAKFIQLLKQYYFIGGMPEAVAAFVKENDYMKVREVQNNILRAYEQDFSKYAPHEIVPRIRLLWNSIVPQLSRENKKFIYSTIKTGARAKDFELALTWLIDCGLVYRIHRVSKPGFPLKAYEDFNAFKLFIVDIGLLAAMGELDKKILLDDSAVFEEFKGAVAEQFVLQELKSNTNLNLFYWSASKGMAEVDFVLQLVDAIVPVEVKAGENLQAKSLKSYHAKYPQFKAVRSSLSDYRQEDWLMNIPLYAIHLLPEIY